MKRIENCMILCGSLDIMMELLRRKTMGRKSKWELERDKEEALKKKALKSLTEDQLKAINKAYESIRDALCNAREIEDLYLSDIRSLDIAMWKLKHQFNLEDNNG
jgi:hypothetical protein